MILSRLGFCANLCSRSLILIGRSKAAREERDRTWIGARAWVGDLAWGGTRAWVGDLAWVGAAEGTA